MKINAKKIREILRLLLIISMVLTVAFIYSKSMKSKEASSAESSKVGEIIAEIIPPETTIGDAIQRNLRKIAHFSEYGALGIEVSLYILFFTKKRVRNGLTSPILGLVVGFIDETIQIFYDRGPSIGDVWIDVGGFCFFSALSYGTVCLALFLAKRIIAWQKHRRSKGGESNG